MPLSEIKSRTIIDSRNSFVQPVVFDIASRIGVPRSTIYGWRKQNPSKVVSLKTHDLSIEELESQVLRLSFQVSKLRCILRLLILLLRLSGYRLDNQRFTDPTTKSRIVREVERAGRVIPLRMTLKILRLSASRYHTWKSSCGLAPLTSCPRSTSQRLSFAETETIHALVTSSEYRHVPTDRLAILAQRMGRVFASPSTWYRLVKERGWRRPIHRIHPAKPTIGVRASKPNEIWHIDTTIVRLWNGAKVYVHAIIDNYTRKILAWQVSESFDTSVPAMLLAQAANNLKDIVPNVFMDSGVENVNGQVDRLFESGTMKRVMAQVDVVFSNSMIEAWWRSLKHQWLYLNKLETTDDVRRHVAF